jgi:hypothetical protein
VISVIWSCQLQMQALREGSLLQRSFRQLCDPGQYS